MDDTPALVELAASGLDARVVHYQRAGSAEEAAARRGVEPGALIKTIVLRREEGEYLLVLVPGDRVIDWPKLRSHLGVSRLSMASQEEALEATGYERGTITPFGAIRRWPVVADASLAERAEVSIGGGAHGVAIHVEGTALLSYLDASVGEVARVVGESHVR